MDIRRQCSAPRKDLIDDRNPLGIGLFIFLRELKKMTGSNSRQILKTATVANSRDLDLVASNDIEL